MVTSIRSRGASTTTAVVHGVTTLGHNADAFVEGSDFPGADEFQTMLVGGIRSAMGLEPFCTPARGNRNG